MDDTKNDKDSINSIYVVSSLFNRYIMSTIDYHILSKECSKHAPEVAIGKLVFSTYFSVKIFINTIKPIGLLYLAIWPYKCFIYSQVRYFSSKYFILSKTTESDENLIYMKAINITNNL